MVARLPIHRASTRSIDPPSAPATALPELTEADPSGSIGRDAFLRAFVVQLSLAIEDAGGPDVGEDGRVIVHLGPAPDVLAPFAHRYLPPRATRPTDL